MKSLATSLQLDRAAVAMSALCALQCLAMPMLLTLAPLAGVSVLSDQVFHLALLVLILPVSVIALSIGCRQHMNLTTVALGAAGLTILTAAATLGHQFLSPTSERVLTIAATLILAAAHIRNYRACRNADCGHATHS